VMCFARVSRKESYCFCKSLLCKLAGKILRLFQPQMNTNGHE
jgi:hypothetical protein